MPHRRDCMGINYKSTKRNHPDGRFLFPGCTLSATGAFILRENAVKTDAAGRSRTLPPVKSGANPYCPANFERKAFLPQILNRNCSQICCTVTGGAQYSARRVTWCVRRDCNSGSLLNRTRSTHQAVTRRPFSPLSFPARRKRQGRRRLDQPASLRKSII